MDTAEQTEPRTRQSYRRELIPLPLRVASSQYSRMAEMRDRTGVSVQEHVRRAIDLYLAMQEREQIELGLLDATKRATIARAYEEGKPPAPLPLHPAVPTKSRVKVAKR